MTKQKGPKSERYGNETRIILPVREKEMLKFVLDWLNLTLGCSHGEKVPAFGMGKKNSCPTVKNIAPPNFGVHTDHPWLTKILILVL